MNIVNQPMLEMASRRHADLAGVLLGWIDMVEKADWRVPLDIKNQFASASFLAGNIVVFNLKGNRYRLVVRAIYADESIAILWIGTHHEYNQLNF